jgi:GxxExxY protein
MKKERYEYLARQIFEASLEVHKHLGPGLLESVYVFALVKELELRGIATQQEVVIPVTYKGFQSNRFLRLDVLVEAEIIIEAKSVDAIIPLHVAQLLSHLKLADKRMGFLINFNVVLIKDGFRRLVNNYFPESETKTT